ncbi:hypothetical protein K0504_03365 [Neiella marina]|uniref:START domain-containing protein n=1 Tax=Neiella holothuriorum TaxID=2870530 RepID=A0ABS7ECL6_9GAMM|nr:START domain-containing protein [Neiella holothuriorum]MBW8190063.1 hypothetical protein [Neiella holothuriorum]
MSFATIQTATANDDEPSLAAPLSQLPAGQWRVHWQRDGALFASRKLNGMKQREYFARLQLPVPAEAMLSLLLDTEQVESWVHHARHAKVLHQLGLDHYIVYSQYSPPWPIRNRDLVTESRHWQTNKGIWLLAQARPRMRSKHSGYLRVQQMQSCWYGKRLGEQRSELTYLGHIQDPGVLPSFIINPAQAQVLEKTLENLTETIIGYGKAPAASWQFPTPKVTGYCQRLQTVISNRELNGHH